MKASSYKISAGPPTAAHTKAYWQCAVYLDVLCCYIYIFSPPSCGFGQSQTMKIIPSGTFWSTTKVKSDADWSYISLPQYEFCEIKASLWSSHFEPRFNNLRGRKPLSKRLHYTFQRYKTCCILSEFAFLWLEQLAPLAFYYAVTLSRGCRKAERANLRKVDTPKDCVYFITRYLVKQQECIWKRIFNINNKRIRWEFLSSAYFCYIFCFRPDADRNGVFHFFSLPLNAQLHVLVVCLLRYWLMEMTAEPGFCQRQNGRRSRFSQGVTEWCCRWDGRTNTDREPGRWKEMRKIDGGVWCWQEEKSLLNIKGKMPSSVWRLRNIFEPMSTPEAGLWVWDYIGSRLVLARQHD